MAMDKNQMMAFAEAADQVMDSSDSPEGKRYAEAVGDALRLAAGSIPVNSNPVLAAIAKLVST